MALWVPDARHAATDLMFALPCCGLWLLTTFCNGNVFSEPLCVGSTQLVFNHTESSVSEDPELRLLLDVGIVSTMGRLQVKLHTFVTEFLSPVC